MKWYAHNYLPLGGSGPRAVFDPALWITDGRAGAPLDPQPVVWVQSQPGLTDTNYNGPVSIAIKSGSGTAGASLWGATTVNAVNGVARFSGLSISKIGVGYRLTASAPGRASSDSNAFAIARGSQTINFAPLADKRYGDPPFPLSASASSGLPVSFSATGVCTVANSVVSLTGSGSCTITAGQVGGIFFTPAPPVVRTFLVVRSFDVYLPMLASL